MKSFKSSVKAYFLVILFILFIAGSIFGPRVIDGFTSIEVLEQRCLEESKFSYRVGAICQDGWRSSATGRGACSHHGGVKRWLYKEEYRKTKKECREYAKERSWLD